MAARKRSDDRVETGRIAMRGRSLVLAVTEWNGKIGLDIRHWFVGSDGVERPDKLFGGVRFYLDDLPVVEEAIADYRRVAGRHTKRAYRVPISPRAMETAPRDKGTAPRDKHTAPRDERTNPKAVDNVIDLRDHFEAEGLPCGCNTTFCDYCLQCDEHCLCDVGTCEA